MSLIRLFSALVLCVLAVGCTVLTQPGPSSPGIDDSGERLFSDARQRVRSGQSSEALRLYGEYLRFHPDGRHAPDALADQADIYADMGDVPSARRSYQMLLERFPDASQTDRATVGLLHMLYKEGRYDDVVRRADDYFRRKGHGSEKAPVYMILGDTCLARGSAVDAVYFYAKANEGRRFLTPSPDMAETRIKAALDFLSSENILTLMERVTDNETRALLLVGMGERQIQKGQYEDGVKTLSQFLDLFPHHRSAEKVRRLVAEVTGYFQGGPLPDAGSGMEDSGFPPPASPGEEGYAGTGVNLEGHAIGCLLPLTGSIAKFGKQAMRGVELAVGRFGNGSGLELVVRDTASDNATSARMVAELDQANVSAIIGPILTADAAARAAQDRGIPIMVFSQKPELTAIGDCVFRNHVVPRLQVSAVVTHAVRSLGLRRFAILYPEERYGEAFNQVFGPEVSAAGAELVASESYNPGTTDFGARIRRIAQAAPDALFLPDAPEKAGLIVPQLTYYGLGRIQLMGTNLWHSDKLVQTARRFVQGAILPEIFFAQSANPAVADFVAAFTRAYGEPPDFMDALAYDSTNMILDIMSRSSSPTRADIKTALRNYDGIRMVTGRTRFSGSGEPFKRMILLRVEGSGFVEVAP